MTAQEKAIQDQVRRGEIQWLPNGRCLFLEKKALEEALVEKSVAHLAVEVEELNTKLASIEKGQNQLLKLIDIEHEQHETSR